MKTISCTPTGPIWLLPPFELHHHDITPWPEFGITIKSYARCPTIPCDSHLRAAQTGRFRTAPLDFHCGLVDQRVMEIQFTTQILKEGRTYVAHTPELDVSSCGGTKENALKNLKEAVRLFLEEAEKLGTLEQILEDSQRQA